MDLSVFEEKIYSQNGEDGVTMKLVELIHGQDSHNKFFVEFGVENGMQCNTRILRERFKWAGLQMDGGNENLAINLRKEFITKESVVDQFKKYNVPHNINLLSVDIDFNDFYCLKEILDNYICDIIICEYNSSHKPDEDKIVMYSKNDWWDYSNYFGASLLSFEKLANKYNYSLVYCEKKGVNCFFIRNDIIDNKNLDFKDFGKSGLIYRAPKYGRNPKGGHIDDPYCRKYLSCEEALSNKYTRIDIGISSENNKVIILEKIYPENAIFTLFKSIHNDCFDFSIRGNILTVTRTDVKEDVGWNHNHKGYIYSP